MRRFFIYLSFFALTNIFFCCQTRNDIRQAFKKELDYTNKQLPQKISFVSLTKLEIVNDDYVVNFEIDETQEDLDSYVYTMSRYKSRILTIVFGQNENFKKLFLSSGLNLELNFVGSISHNKKQLFLYATEIEEAFNSAYSTKDLLSDYVLELKKTLPQDWGDGLTLTSVDVKGNDICYNIKTDESVITMKLLMKNKAEGDVLEESIIGTLSDFDDPIKITFVKYLKQSGMGIKYIYWSEKSSERVTVSLSPQIIKNKVVIKGY